jgi:hypothetical protein
MQDAKSWSNSASFMLIGRTDGGGISRVGVRGSSSLNLPPLGNGSNVDGVRHSKCKDDSNRLPLVCFLEFQLTRASRWKSEVRNGKKIKAATESIP